MLLCSKRSYMTAKLTLDADLHAKVVNACIDTGADDNYIRMSAVPQGSAIAPIPHSVRVVTANEQEIQVRGQITLRTRLGDYITDTVYRVVDALPVPVLLGTGYLEAHVVSINMLDHTLTTRDGTVVGFTTDKLEQMSRACLAAEEHPAQPDKPIPLLLTEQVTLPPRAATHVRIARRHAVQGQPVMVTPSPVTKVAKHLRSQIGLTPGLYPYGHRELVVLMVNWSHETVTLAPMTAIGFIHPSVECIAALPEEADPGDTAPTESDRTWFDRCQVSHLTEEEKAALLQHLAPFRRLFTATNLPAVRNVMHRINVQEGVSPIRAQPYRQGIAAREEVARQIEQQLADGIIQPSASPWASPVVLVKKANGKWRFCVDYRRLNAVTIRDSYPLPRMDDALDSLSRAKLFSVMDARSGYWQVDVAREDREKTAFITHVGHFEYLRMLFGLMNAPSTFQRLMDVTLAGFKWNQCLVYLDDIIVFANTMEEHFRRLQNVLQRLQDAGISLNPEKCIFLTPKVNYLGFTVSHGNIAPQPHKVVAVQGMHSPLATQTAVRSFLGMCGVYRKFIKDYALVSAPLVQLTTKKYGQRLSPQDWTPECEGAFVKLKTLLTSDLVLALYNPDLPIAVECDASGDQLGCTLTQRHPDGLWRPIGYYSRLMSAAERNYGISEK